MLTDTAELKLSLALQELNRLPSDEFMFEFLNFTKFYFYNTDDLIELFLYLPPMFEMFFCILVYCFGMN